MGQVQPPDTFPLVVKFDDDYDDLKATSEKNGKEKGAQQDKQPQLHAKLVAHRVFLSNLR